MSLDGNSVGIKEFIHTGFIQTKKRIEKIKAANRKFITTPASKTADFLNIFFS
jgi:hypothetical protein